MTAKIYQCHALFRHERTPWFLKLFIIMLLAYVLSPVDLIPDFIPVLGVLDELLLVPVCMAFIFKLLPITLRREIRQMPTDPLFKSRLETAGIIMVVFGWVCLAALIVYGLQVILPVDSAVHTDPLLSGLFHNPSVDNASVLK